MANKNNDKPKTKAPDNKEPKTKAPDNKEPKTKAPDNKEPETKDSDNMIEVYIPIDRANENNDKYYCSVNGVAMLIPMGKRVKVPAPYAYAVMNALEEADRVRNRKRGN